MQLAEELAKAQNELNDAQAEIGIFKSDGKQMEMQEILEMQVCTGWRGGCRTQMRCSTLHCEPAISVHTVASSSP